MYKNLTSKEYLHKLFFYRIIIAGAKNNYAYYSKFYAEASVAHSDLLTSCKQLIFENFT